METQNGDLRIIDASPTERAEIAQFREAMKSRAEHVRFGALRSPDGVDMPIPEPLYRVLAEAASTLMAGYQVIVAPVQHQLTTQEAADLLNMSRTYLVRLLDANEIPSERVGRHRRVTFGDVMTYKKRRLEERRIALTELIHESEEAGLYGREDAV